MLSLHGLHCTAHLRSLNPQHNSGLAGAKWITSALLLISTVGCQGTYNGFLRPVGPDYCRPKAPVAESWIDSADERVLSVSDDHSQWWRVFDDPVLSNLIIESSRQNLPLRAAGMRVLEARAQAGIARGNLFPQLQELFGSYDRAENSNNIQNNQFAEKFFSQWQAGFNATWELDFWGRFRRAIESADANVDASIENYDDVLVLLLAEVAATYVEARTLEQRVDYAMNNVEIQRRSLEIATARFNAGAVTELDVQQGRSNLAQTESTIPQLQSSYRQATNRLCTLLGIPPQDLDPALSTQSGIPIAPPDVALGIPAELLRRRPDVRRAEREVASQSALIGVAASDLYPQIAISGFIGVDANDFNDLFESQSTFGAVGPAFRWNILNYGRIRNNILSQDARFQQLVYRYQETVLQANAEVENALVAFLRAQEQAASLTESVNATGRSVDLAQTQYRQGLIDYDRVTNLQALLTNQQDQLAISEGSIAANLIGVYKALGGGWQIRLNRPRIQRLPESGAADNESDESIPEENGQREPLPDG